MKYYYSTFMSDCRQEIEKLTIDKQEKKERLNNQQKTLANLSQTNQDKKRMDLECNYLTDKVLEQNMANEIDNLHKQKSEIHDRTKLLKHTRDRQKQLFSDISKVEEDLENWQCVNEEKLPKIDLNRETNRKKEKEDIEDINRVLSDQTSGRDDAKHQFDHFKKKKEEYEAQIKQQGDQLSFYRQDNKAELENYIRNEEALIEYKTLTYKQSAKIKELKDEIDTLNKKFPEEVSKHTKEIEFMKADNENKRSELDFKYQAMSDTLRVRHKESKQLRKHLQMILDQRSELEHFFIEEIQNSYLKKLKIKEDIKNKYGVTKEALRMTNDLMQFRWSERQEIIEKVFAKINNGKLPLYWRELDIEDIRKTIIEEQERKAQMRRGEIPDDSEAQRTLERDIENP